MSTEAHLLLVFGFFHRIYLNIDDFVQISFWARNCSLPFFPSSFFITKDLEDEMFFEANSPVLYLIVVSPPPDMET